MCIGIGVAKYLLNNYDLSRVEMSGTSCGALCATLTACGVDPHEIVQSAYELSLENDLWSRPLGERATPLTPPSSPSLLSSIRKSAVYPISSLVDLEDPAVPPLTSLTLLPQALPASGGG